MTSEEILSALSVRIYEPPLSLARESGQIADYTGPLCAVMLIIDFETAVMMNGIVDFLGNSSGLYASHTVEALRQVGCQAQATQLESILNIATEAGMSHEAIQAERGGLPEFSVVTFTQIHGQKWHHATQAMSEAASSIDFRPVWERVIQFIESHRDLFDRALRHE